MTNTIPAPWQGSPGSNQGPPRPTLTCSVNKPTVTVLSWYLSTWLLAADWDFVVLVARQSLLQGEAALAVSRFS